MWAFDHVEYWMLGFTPIFVFVLKATVQSYTEFYGGNFLHANAKVSLVCQDLLRKQPEFLSPPPSLYIPRLLLMPV